MNNLNSNKVKKWQFRRNKGSFGINCLVNNQKTNKLPNKNKSKKNSK